MCPFSLHEIWQIKILDFRLSLFCFLFFFLSFFFFFHFSCCFLSFFFSFVFFSPLFWADQLFKLNLLNQSTMFHFSLPRIFHSTFLFFFSQQKPKAARASEGGDQDGAQTVGNCLLDDEAEIDWWRRRFSIVGLKWNGVS